MNGLHGLSLVASQLARLQEGQGAASMAPSSLQDAVEAEAARRPSLSLRKRPFEPALLPPSAAEATNAALLRIARARHGLGAAPSNPRILHPGQPLQPAAGLPAPALHPHLLHPGRRHEASGRCQPLPQAHPAMTPGPFGGRTSSLASTASSSVDTSELDVLISARQRQRAHIESEILRVQSQQRQRAQIEGEILRIQDERLGWERLERRLHDELLARRLAAHGPPMAQAPVSVMSAPAAVGSLAPAGEDAGALAPEHLMAAQAAHASPFQPQKSPPLAPASAFQAIEAVAHSTQHAMAHSKPGGDNDRRLFLPSDPSFLPEAQCFLRATCLEAFVATSEDVHPKHAGRAGFRCLHCKDAPAHLRAKQAACFPSKLSSVMESVRNFKRFHLDECPYIPATVKTQYRALTLRSGPRRSGRLVRAYYAASARDVGFVDTPKGLGYRPENRRGRPSDAMAELLTAAKMEDEALAKGSTLASLYAHEGPRESTVDAAPSQDEEVRHGKLGDVATDATRHVLRAAQQEATPLVHPSDFASVPDHVYLLFAQLIPCHPTEATLTRRRSDPDVDPTQLHVPGVRCRHCAAEDGGHGAYFPRTARSLGDSSFAQTLWVHIAGCEGCPREVKGALDELAALAKEHRSSAKRGSKKKFVARVWRRLEEVARQDNEGVMLEGIEEGAKWEYDQD